MGLEKKEERAFCSKIELVPAQKEEGKKKQPKIDPILERGKSVRTLLHVRHFPDLPFGEVTIEGLSPLKHCTTQQQRKVQQ